MLVLIYIYKIYIKYHSCSKLKHQEKKIIYFFKYIIIKDEAKYMHAQIYIYKLYL